MSYLGILALLSLLIVIHELGHLVAAKRAGIPVAGFSVGFGPKLWTRRWGQVEYSLRALPLGGFVMLAVTDEEELRAIPLRKRLAFYLGGPLANLLAALPALSVLNGIARGVSFYQLVVLPFRQIAAACWQVLGALASLPSRPESISGVVGIVVEGGRLAQSGKGLEIAISLSVSLAVFNLLPIPMLDGGQITMACLEEVFPRFAKLRIPLTLLGMIVLAIVMVYSNGHDLIHYLNQAHRVS
ncbi:MAG TPA: site-2 protease family protein [Thermoanaerobaculia bacterium]|jgi:regulator of sigma E protease|nr:site-2 protease family protein [Thermoanaerobaculia bacterium]